MKLSNMRQTQLLLAGLLVFMVGGLTSAFARCDGATGSNAGQITFCIANAGCASGNNNSNYGVKSTATCQVFCCPGDGDAGLVHYDSCGEATTQIDCCLMGGLPVYTPGPGQVRVACPKTATPPGGASN